MRPAGEPRAWRGAVRWVMGKAGSVHDPWHLRRLLATARRRHGRGGCQTREARRRQTPPAPSSTGDERCAARGTTPVRRGLTARDLGCTATMAWKRIARCIDAVTGVACSRGSTRRRLLRGRWLDHRRVRGAARGACSLAFRIPHHSNRGSLHRLRQVLVPVIASGRFGCYVHPAGSVSRCQAGFSGRTERVRARRTNRARWHRARCPSRCASMRLQPGPRHHDGAAGWQSRMLRIYG